MSAWSPDLTKFEKRRIRSAIKNEEHTALPIPRHEQKTQTSKCRQVLQVGRHGGFWANTGRNERQEHQDDRVEPGSGTEKQALISPLQRLRVRFDTPAGHGGGQ